MNFEEMCACGHVGDEHGGDEQHPGSTACTVETEMGKAKRKARPCPVCRKVHGPGRDPRCAACGQTGPRREVMHTCPDCFEPWEGKR